MAGELKTKQPTYALFLFHISNTSIHRGEGLFNHEQQSVRFPKMSPHYPLPLLSVPDLIALESLNLPSQNEAFLSNNIYFFKSLPKEPLLYSA
jgi:hypothetical protein